MRHGIKKPCRKSCKAIFTGGRGWIRTTEAEATDLQSAPFGRSGTLPQTALTLAPMLILNPMSFLIRIQNPCTRHGILYKRHTGVNGRGDRTWTCGILLPKQALYQTELRPAVHSLIIISQKCTNVKQYFRQQRKFVVFDYYKPFAAVLRGQI